MTKLFCKSISAIAFVMTSVSYTASNQQTYAYGYDSFKQVILSCTHDKCEKIDPSGLIVFLGHLDDNQARKLLIDLSYYYLGSAHGEAFEYAVVSQGKKILKMLEESSKKDGQCNKEEHERYKCYTLDERKDRLAGLIQRIKNGDTAVYDL